MSCYQPQRLYHSTLTSDRIRFTCQIYSDNLIDKPHFLDWLVSSLVASDLDTLPVWLILIHIFLDDLTVTRKRGARLTEALLAHMNEVCRHRKLH